MICIEQAMQLEIRDASGRACVSRTNALLEPAQGQALSMSAVTEAIGQLGDTCLRPESWDTSDLDLSPGGYPSLFVQGWLLRVILAPGGYPAFFVQGWLLRVFLPPGGYPALFVEGWLLRVFRSPGGYPAFSVVGRLLRVFLSPGGYPAFFVGGWLLRVFLSWASSSVCTAMHA